MKGVEGDSAYVRLQQAVNDSSGADQEGVSF
jgi:hypothetical protein